MVRSLLFALGLPAILVSCAEEAEPTLCERLPGTAYETVKGYGCGPLGPLCKLPLYFATDGMVHVSYGDYDVSGPYVCEGQLATAMLSDAEIVFEFDAEGDHVIRHGEETEYVVVNCLGTGTDRPEACAWGESFEP